LRGILKETDPLILRVAEVRKSNVEDPQLICMSATLRKCEIKLHAPTSAGSQLNDSSNNICVQQKLPRKNDANWQIDN
jgi:hypothetical protein